MTKFKKFTLRDTDMPVYIDMNKVNYFTTSTDGCTTLHFDENNFVSIKEGIEAIIRNEHIPGL